MKYVESTSKKIKTVWSKTFAMFGQSQILLFMLFTWHILKTNFYFSTSALAKL